MLHTIYLAILLMISGQNVSFFEQADNFFSEYVKEGQVDYAAIKEHPDKLNQLVKYIGELDLSNKRVTPEFLKAFYINAYNILVVKQVVDRYPIEGPMRVDGFFEKITHEVMGDRMSLDQLEKEVLYKHFPDERLHFVLVCAAQGCPPLASFSYQPEELNEQLTQRTSEVLNLESFIRVKGDKVEISRIFDWYRDDFQRKAGSALAYINAYRENKIEETKQISFYEYDWSLNDK